MNIPSQIIYDTSTGNVLVVTPECLNSMLEQPPSIEEIRNKYNISSDIEISFLTLEVGSMTTIFNNAKSYKVNIKTKKLEVIYFTPEELQSMENQGQEDQVLNNRISDISSYLMEQHESITNVEDYILQTELNKIMEGMI